MYVMKVNKLADMVVKMPNKDFTDGVKGDNNNMNNNKKEQPQPETMPMKYIKCETVDIS